MNIGVDIDGVLADFNTPFIALIKKMTGRELPQPSATYPDVWAYHIAGGVTPEENAKLWDYISNSDWVTRHQPTPTGEAALEELNFLAATGYANVYFITNRGGAHAKRQTEAWLTFYGMKNPTVLIANSDAAKGQLAAGLKLDVFIDDKPENCAHVVDATKSVGFFDTDYPCEVFLVDAPYNRDFEMRGVTRVVSALQALERVTERDGEQLRRAA